MAAPGYWSSPWPAEDGGPRRLQVPVGLPGPDFASGKVTITSREAVATTMLVLREPGEVYALRHTAGPDALSWVERIDPVTLETVAAIARSRRRADLARRARGARERWSLRGVRRVRAPARR